MVNVGDEVQFFTGDGRGVVMAEVTKVNGDEDDEHRTIDLLYPHPNGNAAAEGIRASASQVPHGAGVFHFLERGEQGAYNAPPAGFEGGHHPDDLKEIERLTVANIAANEQLQELETAKATAEQGRTVVAEAEARATEAEATAKELAGKLTTAEARVTELSTEVVDLTTEVNAVNGRLAELNAERAKSAEAPPADNDKKGPKG